MQGPRYRAYLHYLQILQALLYELLYAAGIVDISILAKRISCATSCVLSEVVRGKLFSLPQQLSVL
jgi:hypothetical protein